MKKQRKWVRTTVEAAVWLAALIFVGARVWPQLAAAMGLGSDGPKVHDVRLLTLSGDSISLSELQGRVVLVNFWATWCPPCRVEMPGFEDVYQKYRDAGFTVLGVSLDRGSRDAVTKFVGDRNLSFPIAMATAEAVSAFGNPTALPTSFLIDRQGRIRYTVRGIFARPALERAVTELLDEEQAEVS